VRVSRRFSPQIEALAKEWCENPIASNNWITTGRRPGGESQTFEVRRPDGLLAVAKPGPGVNQSQARQAHEKIVSDLAYLLDIPLPPVALLKIAPFNVETPYWVSLSVRCFPRAVELAVARAAMNPAQLEYFDNFASMAWAFDTWIGNHDRHDGNCIIEDSVDENSWSGAVLIDHGHTLSYSWKSTDPVNIFAPRFMGNRRRKEMAMVKAERIACLPDSDIYGIVNRLPDDVIDPLKKKIISSELIRRKPELVGFLNRQYYS